MPQALHIRNGSLIDGNGTAPVPDTDVVIDGDAIVAVGPAGTLDARVPEGATVIDAKSVVLVSSASEGNAMVAAQSERSLFEAAVLIDPSDTGFETVMTEAAWTVPARHASRGRMLVFME